jgi:hypothetical protein
MNDGMQKAVIAQCAKNRIQSCASIKMHSIFNFLDIKLLDDFALKHMLILFLYINYEFDHKFKAKSEKEVKSR